MRYFLFSLGGAGVASLWWASVVFRSLEKSPNEVSLVNLSVLVSILLLGALVWIAWIEKKL